MKTCPACHRMYADDGMSFCLDDGTELLLGAATSDEAGATIKIPAGRLTNQSPTEVLPVGVAPAPSRLPQTTAQYAAPAAAPSTERKQSAMPWILGAAVVLGLSAIAVAWIMTRSGATERSATEPTVTPLQTPDTTNTGDPALIPPERMTAPSPPGVVETRGSNGNGNVTRRGIGDGTGPGPVRVPSTVPEPGPPPAPTPLQPRAPVSGGVLNGRAISIPAPSYPPIAKSVHASGKVNVQVTIDESGKVISATAASGHPLLQQSAVKAAYQARFTPTRLSGQPVKVTGIIVYNFVAQ